MRQTGDHLFLFWTEYFSEQFVSDRSNCHQNRETEAKNSKPLCQKPWQNQLKSQGYFIKVFGDVSRTSKKWCIT